MLLLHAADLHLGKTLHERDIGPDQEVMLESLLARIEEARPAALLLAGDLYDRSIPPPEAVRLFDSFLSRAAEIDPGLIVVAIPGNHDSAARLSFGTSIMSRAGVHIRTVPEDCVRPIVVERDGERAAIWALPFLGSGAFDATDEDVESPGESAGRPLDATGGAARAEAKAASQGELDFSPDAGEAIRTSGAIHGQAELFAEAMRRIVPRLLPDSRNILLSHCFAVGGLSSESERSFVGQAEQVDARSFEAFDYVALGHLHRFQKAGAKGRYAGSPLAYSFAEGEDEKGFVLVDLKSSGGFEARLLPVKPLRAMRRIEGPFSVLSAPGAFPEYRGDFVEARLTDPEPVLNPADPLRANFPNLLSVRQAAFELSRTEGLTEGPIPFSEGRPSILADFAAFHAEMKGSAPDEETVRLFESLVKEAGSASL
jgi:DNA repair protein SbcD/Mre11